MGFVVAEGGEVVNGSGRADDGRSVSGAFPATQPLSPASSVSGIPLADKEQNNTR